MFKVENTGTPAWKMITDESGKHIANLDELSNGDWALVYLGGREKITPSSFTNGSRAVSWLWKNRIDLGEPFSTYEEKAKKKVTSKSEKIEPVEEPSEDLFWDYKK